MHNKNVVDNDASLATRQADAACAWGGGSIILEITNTFTIKNAA